MYSSSSEQDAAETHRDTVSLSRAGKVLLVSPIRDHGFLDLQAVRAGRLDEALGLLGETGFDAVVLDPDLPDCTGLESVRALAAAAPQVPIVLLVEPGDLDRAIEGLRAGATHYMVKGQPGGHERNEGMEQAMLYAIERMRTEEGLARREREYLLVEAEAGERARELAGLLEVSRDVASTLELKPLLSRILDQLRRVADYSSCAISIVKGGEMELWDVRAGRDDGPRAILRSFPLELFGPIWEVLQRGEPVVIPDARAEGIYPATYRAILAWLIEATTTDLERRLETDLAYIRSWMAVPLMLKEQAIGTLTLAHEEPGYYNRRHVQLTTAISNHAAVAIENARLYEQAKETARSTEALAQIASRVAFGGSLEATLDEVCHHVVNATGAVAAAVVLFEPGLSSRHMVGSFGHPQGYVEAANGLLASGEPLFAQAAYDDLRPVLVRDMRRRMLGSQASAALHPFMELVAWDTLVAVPMVYAGNQVGVLLSYYPPDRDIGEREMAFHEAIANQAAVAVENARLLGQVEKRAAQEQRQRLARELHDSVSQALFSINLTARAIETMLKREGISSAPVEARLNDLAQLTSGAMAEMKALIFELRPGALEEEGLLSALRKHAAAVQARELLPIAVVSRGEVPRLKPAAEEGLYRIAQEALHNIIKHSHATVAEISLELDEPQQRIVLRVKDDGAGFDASAIPPGHLGLGTMRQRADSLRGECRIESAPGQGAEVIVSVPLADWGA